MSDVNPELAAVLIQLAEGYPNVRLRQGTFHAYAVALSDLSIADLTRAAHRALRECQYFPTAAELRRFVEPSPDDAALIQWAAFQQAASAVGAWSPLAVEDTAAGVALMAVFGSWAAFCQSDGATIGARRQEFLAAYREAKRTNRFAGTVILPGLTQQRDRFGLMTRHGQVEAFVKKELVGLAEDATKLLP